jgi:hypothetical protein
MHFCVQRGKGRATNATSLVARRARMDCLVSHCCLGSDEHDGFHDIDVPVQVEYDGLKQPVKPFENRVDFHSAGLLFRGPVGESELDIDHNSNIKRCRPDEIIHGTPAIIDGDCSNSMARLGRHNSSLCGTLFSEGEMAREIRARAR